MAECKSVIILQSPSFRGWLAIVEGAAKWRRSAWALCLVVLRNLDHLRASKRLACISPDVISNILKAYVDVFGFLCLTGMINDFDCILAINVEFSGSRVGYTHIARNITRMEEMKSRRSGCNILSLCGREGNYGLS